MYRDSNSKLMQSSFLFFALGTKLMQVAYTHIHQLACKAIKSRCISHQILSINVKGHIPPFTRQSL